MSKEFENNKDYIIENIMQLKISKYIKENKNIDRNLLMQKINELLEEKEKMYMLDDEELIKVLRK